MKLMIVDDEPNTRNGIRKFIKWQDVGINDIRVASNGEYALNIILEGYTPDIILCDVRMPKMDGIEFIGKVRQTLNYIDIEVIYLSGFSDKEYLKAAIKYNVFDYIEKPVDISQVKQVVSNAVAKINNRKLKNSKLELKNAYFSQKYDLSVLTKTILCYKYNRLAIIEISNYNNSSFSKDNLIAYIENTQSIKLYAQVTVNIFIICFSSDNIIDIEDRKIICFYNSYISNHNLDVIMTIGDIQSNDRCIDKMIYQIKSRHLRSFYLGCNSIILCDKIPEKENYNKNILDNAIILLDKILKNKEYKKLYLWLEEIKRNIVSMEAPPSDIIDFFVKAEKMILFQSVLNFNADNVDYNILLNLDKDKIYYQDYIIYIKNLIDDILELVNESKNTNLPINNIIKYINKNYNKSFTIKDLSNTFAYSPNYISNMFKDKMKISIHQYIINLRINKAKEMIISGEQSLNKIANSIGYKEYSHFSKVFRNTTGMAPKQYKNNNIV